ncbi:MAG: tRNA (N(6)-L-threonylcarbamoyladenosine(37)-C(2))-methylthiotransferase MtaB [Clostridia bacterium]|nr:tRNA (N(6)-L-threonylcarbamoyladenosine(37)-C(2))-methylthiotransferase MtaB [Clostridia bacterium]
MNAAIYTLGCKVNQYESQALRELLEREGFSVVAPDEDADVYIVNSCTVTAVADQKTRQRVRRCKREHPDSIVVLTGCMAQAFPKDAEALPEADIILGHRSQAQLPALLAEYQKFGKRVVRVPAHESKEPFTGARITTFDERTRACVKIEDGCNRFCSYCVIPYARGRVRSKPLEELKAELEAVAAKGYREVVLIGINLSAYGQDIDKTFPDAVRLANSIDGIDRVRLGSLEPDHLTDAVIDALAGCKKLCGQFHISLQSGCDRTLKRMNRHYTAAEYRALAQKLRAAFPGCTLTTDVMVGFCGETDDDFEESLRFVESIGFEKLHVFPYSVREGTKAAALPGHLPKRVKDERAARMLQLGDELRKRFFTSQIGHTVRVLFESAPKEGVYTGYTANYLPVQAESDEDLCGKEIAVHITGVGHGDYVIGTVCEE